MLGIDATLGVVASFDDICRRVYSESKGILWVGVIRFRTVVIWLNESCGYPKVTE
jgi:hypothetical protein